MIIKCKKCDNVFLAPDDLEEGQELKCGNCGDSWKLEHKTQEIPGEIKPTESTHKEDFKSSEPKEGYAIKGIIIFVIILIIIGFSAVHFKKEVFNILPKAEKHTLKETQVINPEALIFENLRAVEEGDFVKLTGTIINTGAKEMTIPKILIADKLYVKTQQETIESKGSANINAILPGYIQSPIKVSF